jgi:hypothetical protein
MLHTKFRSADSVLTADTNPLPPPPPHSRPLPQASGTAHTWAVNCGNRTALPPYSGDMHNMIESSHAIICDALQVWIDERTVDSHTVRLTGLRGARALVPWRGAGAMSPFPALTPSKPLLPPGPAVRLTYRPRSS